MYADGITAFNFYIFYLNDSMKDIAYGVGSESDFTLQSFIDDYKDFVLLKIVSFTALTP